MSFRDEIFKFISENSIVDETVILWEFRKHKERMNREIILNNNLRLVYKIVDSRCRMSGAIFEEIFSAGYLGLDHAVDKYNSFIGCKFSTYAYYWILKYVNTEIWKLKGRSTDSLDVPLQNYPNTTLKDLLVSEDKEYVERYESDEIYLNCCRFLNSEEKEIFRKYYIEEKNGKAIIEEMKLTRQQIYYKLDTIKKKLKGAL